MLTVSDDWKRAVKAGTHSPRLIVEIRPTVLYAEIMQGGDWKGAASCSGVNLAHPTGELILDNETVEHEEKQPVSKRLGTTGLLNFNLFRGEIAEGWDSYDRIGQYVQTFRVDTAFKLQKIRLGVRNDHRDENHKYDKFKGQLIVRLFSNLEEPGQERIIYQTGAYPNKNAQWAIRDLYGDRVETLLSTEVDFSDGTMRGASLATADDNIFIEIDCADENIWVPGSGNICAIDLSASEQAGSENLLLYGAANGAGYDKGQLYEHNHQTGNSYNRDADLGFVPFAAGFKSTGEAVFEFDLSAEPDESLSGELEICCSEPGDSSISFQVKEKPDGGAWGSWDAAVDGTALTGKRYVQVKVIMSASSDQLNSPRVYSIRAVYKRSDSFVWGPRPINGYPNLVSSAPTYSAEGDPLTGALQFSDTSTIELLDPSNMISRIFSLYNLKNDEVNVKLGFDGLDPSNFVQVKSLWIENWQPGEGVVSINCYDKQRRIRSVEIPSINQTPELSEQIHFNKVNPAAIKRELLTRAGERPSKIDSTSFTALESFFNWLLTHVIEKPIDVQKVCKALNGHLLSFEYIDEAGKWVTPYVDFGASPVATIESSEVLIGRESFSPGWEGVKNIFAVFCGGKGNDEKKYRELTLLPDTDSEERFKEISPDKLFSEFIPGDDDPGDVESGIALEVANRRRIVQRDGFREVLFSTLLDRADIQLGDPVYFYSQKYRRAGAANPNPLLVFITRKHIDTSLSRINWRGLVLLDAEQSAPGLTAVNPPQNFDVADNGNRTATWTWDASASDNGTNILCYLLYRRKRYMSTWGAAVARVEATGAASYEYTDAYKNCLTYDFGIRAVYKDRRVSAIVTKDKLTITDSTLAAPTWTLVPVIGGWKIYVTEYIAGAIKYYVYKYAGTFLGWERVGEIKTPTFYGLKAGYGHYNHHIEKLYGVEYGRFKLSTLNGVAEGTLSDEQAAWSIPYQGTKLASDMTPSMPAEAGTYPKLTLIQNISGEFKYSVELKIEAPAGYEDLVGRYELERRDNSSGDYGAWANVGVKIIDKHPAPLSFPWINEDVQFKPGVTYQWRVRARAQDGTASPWSNVLTKQVTGDSTPPDQPSITVVSMDLKNMIVISSPKKGGVELKGAFLYFQIQAYLQGNGSWFDLDKTKSELVFHGFEPGDLGQVHKYRVRTWDTSNNYSQWSDESAWTTALKVGQTSLDDSVNTLLTQVTTNEEDITYNATQISQNATDILLRAYQTSLDTTNGNVSQNSSEISLNATQIGLRVKWDGNETSIVLSQDGTHIKGDLLKIDGNVEITGDAVIQGILKANSGIKTATSGTRLEIGRYSGVERVSLLSDGYITVDLKAFDSYGSFVVSNKNSIDKKVKILCNSICLYNYLGTEKIKLYQDDSNGAIYINENKVIGSRGSAIANATAETVVARVNDILAFLRGWEAIAT